MVEHSFDGPLHLQRYLGPCAGALEDTVRSVICHPVTLVRSLRCECAPNKLLSLVGREEIKAPALQFVRAQRIIPPEDRRSACRLFLLRVNDEEGVVHSSCQRCNRLMLLDRTLYWGLKRSTDAPPATYPYKCSCGENNYEVLLGFEYPDDAFDENDINMLTIVVRCAPCGQIAVVFDDEAT